MTSNTVTRELSEPQQLLTEVLEEFLNSEIASISEPAIDENGNVLVSFQHDNGDGGLDTFNATINPDTGVISY